MSCDNGVQLYESWPGSNPDLSLNETCWAIVQKAVAVYLTPYLYMNFHKVIKQTWIERVTTENYRQLDPVGFKG